MELNESINCTPGGWGTLQLASLIFQTPLGEAEVLLCNNREIKPTLSIKTCMTLAKRALMTLQGGQVYLDTLFPHFCAHFCRSFF